MKFMQERINGTLESRGGIAQTEGHDAVLKGPPPGLKSRTLPVLREYQDLVKPTAQIHLGEYG